MSNTAETKPLHASDYLPLVAFLTTHKDDEVTWTFAEIEQLLGRPLPRSAFTSAWWKNYAKNTHTRAWIEAGWALKRAEPRQRRVTFTRRRTGGGSIVAEPLAAQNRE